MASMTFLPRSRFLLIAVSAIGGLLLAADVALAEVQYVTHSDEVRWTFLLSAMILAAGMIGAALILRRPK